MTDRRVVLGALLSGGAALAVGVRRWSAPSFEDAALPPFLTDASLFYDRHSAKRFDPVYLWTRLTRPDLIPPTHEPSEGPWTLRIDGAVDAALTATEADLVAASGAGGARAFLKTMRCSGDAPSNRLASNGLWEGIPLRSLLASASPRAGARKLRLHAEDGFTTNLPLDGLQAADGREVLLATRLNGRPLPFARGGPVRVITPDRYGFKNPKWISRIEVTADPAAWGNHEVAIRGGTDEGRVFPGVKLLDPPYWGGTPTFRAAPGPLRFVGLAFGGLGAVKSVLGRWRGPETTELTITAQLRRPAELDSHPDVLAALGADSPWPRPDTWVPFELAIPSVTRGTYSLCLSVIDTLGEGTVAKDPTRIDGDSSEIRIEVEVG